MVDSSGFEGGGLRVPKVQIVGSDSIPVESKSNNIALRVVASDSFYILERINILVNGVPVYGKRGLQLRDKKINRYDNTFPVELSAGKNRVEISVLNNTGNESYRDFIQVTYTPVSPPASKLYFIGIGIDRFKQPGFNLAWSVKDIRDLSNSFKNIYKNDCEIILLLNEDVTLPNILRLKQRLLKTSVNDKVVIAYSGHGLLNKDFDYYLSTYDINFDKPGQNGLSYTNLEDLLDSIPARNKLMLIDACHSGEIDKEEIQRYTNEAPGLKLAGVTGSNDKNKGAHVENKDAVLGIKNSFELMQELFINIGKQTGATIISAATGKQLAKESSELKNGVFTYCIREYMQLHKHANLAGLKYYINNRVPELTRGLQQPTSRSESVEDDWNVW